MVVTTQACGREVIGLHVGAANAKRFFPKRMRTVELHLGDLRIECTLPPGFWVDQPQIHDPRLCEWLKFKVFQESENRQPLSLAMEQSGSNAFRLQAIGPAQRERRRTAISPAA